CRTAALGGHLWQCDHCSLEVFSYHGCKNRSCSKCHTDDTERWLQARKLEMLPCHYFHVTVTAPEELRRVLRANQRDGYGLLLQAAAEAIIDIAGDPRFVGGTVGVLAVLHTWTQQLNYHPHVHCLVTGGGVSRDDTCWHPARPSYFAPETAIAKLVRGKLKAWFAQKRPDLIIPATVWTTPWVVKITRWGDGENAVLRYLARYVFRIAITNSRIVALDDAPVSFSPTSTANPTAGASAASMARSSCAVSCSTSSPKACTRFAISDFGIRASGQLPAKPACCCTCNVPTTSHPRWSGIP